MQRAFPHSVELFRSCAGRIRGRTAEWSGYQHKPLKTPSRPRLLLVDQCEPHPKRATSRQRNAQPIKPRSESVRTSASTSIPSAIHPSPQKYSLIYHPRFWYLNSDFLSAPTSGLKELLMAAAARAASGAFFQITEPASSETNSNKRGNLRTISNVG